MIAIKYVPLAINATGLGSVTYYNDDSAHSDASVSALFATAKSDFTIGSDIAYSAELVDAPDRTNLLAGNYSVIDSFAQGVSALSPYVYASAISGATIVNGQVVVGGGGGSSIFSFVPNINSQYGKQAALNGNVGAGSGTAALSNYNVTPVAVAGTFGNLYVRFDANTNGTETLTLYKNNVAQALAVSVTVGTSSGIDSANTVAAEPGDLFSVMWGGSGDGPSHYACSLKFTAS